MNRYICKLVNICRFLLIVLFVTSATAVSAKSSVTSATRIVFSSDSMVYIVAPDRVHDGFSDGVVWQLNAMKWPAAKLGVEHDRLSHIDECKPVDNGCRLMLTSSFGWAAIVDTVTSAPVFFATGCVNAHSIERISDNMVAVACSEKGDQIRLYTNTFPAQLLDTVPMTKAHGVAWIGERGRLYAVGADKLCVFTVDDNKLNPVQTIALPEARSHDISVIDSDNLLISGRKSFVYNIDSQTWTELPLFVNSLKIKSVNCNPVTRELWYTDATDSKAAVPWRCDKIFHASAPDASAPDIAIGLEGRTAYKVRVIRW